MPTVEELDAMTIRQTGRSLQEWDELHTSQRSRDVRKGRIRTDRPLTTAMMQSWIRLYGFKPSDFQATLISCSAARNFERGFEVPHDARTGNHATNVIRWFLKPEVIPT